MEKKSGGMVTLDHKIGPTFFCVLTHTENQRQISFCPLLIGHLPITSCYLRFFRVRCVTCFLVNRVEHHKLNQTTLNQTTCCRLIEFLVR